MWKLAQTATALCCWGLASTGLLPAAVTLSDRAERAGVEFRHEASATAHKYLIETMGGGVALLDFNDDGWLDIFFVNSGSIRNSPGSPRIHRSEPNLHNRLYRNNRDGSFTDVTEGSGLSQHDTQIYGMGAATGDFDNDGFTDLAITGYGGVQLFRNDGDGVFVDITPQSGIEAPGWSASAGFADLDADGLLDFFVTRYLDWSFADHVACGEEIPSYCPPDRHRAVTSKVFRNTGRSKFIDMSGQSGLAALPGKALGVAFNDIEHDGDIDIVVANDAEPQQLLRNEGEFRLVESGLAAGVAYNEDGGRFAGMGVDFSDYDNDGRPDILITNLARELYALFRNEGANLFGYATRQSRLAIITGRMSGWGVRLADLDLDGWKDLFVAQGHVLDTIERTDPGVPYRQPPLLALGSNGLFQDVSEGAGGIFAEALAGRGAAFGDLDNDGDLDVVISVLDENPHVLYNDAADKGRRWIMLRLVGRTSPRDGQGARVLIQTPDGKQQFRFATTAGSYLSASDPRVHFGLGANNTVERVRIRWSSGIEQELRDVQANRIVTVREGQGGGQ